MSAISRPSDAQQSYDVPSSRDSVESLNKVSFPLTVMSLIMVAVAIILIGLAFTQMLMWRDRPFLGALTTRSLMVDGSVPIGEEGWVALDEGILRLDRIVALNGQTLSADLNDYTTALRRFNEILGGTQTGDALEITVLRPVQNGEVVEAGSSVCGPVENGFATCTLTVMLSQFPDIDYIAFFVVPFVSGITAIAISLLIMVVRWRQLNAYWVSLAILGLGVFMIGLFDLSTTFSFIPLWLVIVTSTGGFFTSLVLVFPTRAVISYKIPVLRFLPPLITLVIGIILAYLYLNSTDYRAAATMSQIATIIGVGGMLVLIISLLRLRTSAHSIILRDQINTALLGFGVAAFVGILWAFSLVVRQFTGIEMFSINTSLLTPFLLLPVIGLAYAALQYQPLNTDRFMSQSITYSIMLILLVVGYFLLVYGVSTFIGRVLPANNPLILALVVFALALFFLPFRTRIQALVDKQYFKQQLNYQELIENFAFRLGSLTSYDMIVREYESLINSTLQPEKIFFFARRNEENAFVEINNRTDVRFAFTSSLIQYLERANELVYLEYGKPWDRPLTAEKARLTLLKSLIIVGMKGENQLRQIIIITPPASGLKYYNFEQLRFVQSLSNQISVAIERTQVVDALEHRIRELNVLSQVGQAANFAVTFDDLLELITTQAQRLIPASHFYIALRDSDSNAFYYALFLENEERYSEKENQRWMLENDPLSDVIRHNHIIRLESFEDEVNERNLDHVREDRTIKAWMAVPMSVGGQVLGALAAGSQQVGRNFTDEQEKTFADIAALAATALDKTRLFEEANTRARQLASLNDISRQIVAEEANLENLMRLITQSAADILDAEAGSLLLETEDGSSDLEFRVATGDAGSELIGVRVPHGKGLVGEVASRGEPVIVNDVRSDARWGGEVSEDGFQTRNVLAVPLIVQDRVIGVLEILNKRGGGFTTNDTQLLTTYAGQTAVAIENARLFQLTDLQLSQRVNELETLERIDVELNRSLDLHKTAALTVDWAMENTGATAGMLGLVRGTPPYLELVYQKGYDEADLPAGTQGGRIPMDRGIASRTLRTRQPDLAPDVQQDPDYLPSLRGALSQITLPMISGGTVNALVVLETNREPRFRIVDMPVLQRLIEHASIAIANAQLYEEVARANQSKSEFVSFIAHELKNPLTSIKGYSDVLLMGATGALSDGQKNFLTTIRSNAERMTTMVSDLNDVTKIETGNMRITPSAIHISEVIIETLRPFQKQIDDKQQRVNLEIPADLPQVYADANRMIQVLTNIVSNAHKYSPPNGEITVTAYVDGTLVNAKGAVLPPMMHLMIRDTGIGMSQADLNKLFTPYFRSENPLTREQPGTGLGLTITRALVQNHGGQIWVESEIGIGTVFHITLPLATKED